MIQDATKGGFPIVAVKKNVNERPSESHGPDEKEKPSKGIAAVDWRTGISVSWRRFRDGVIGRADGIRSVGAVNADASFALADGPLKWVEKQTQDDESETFGRMTWKDFSSSAANLALTSSRLSLILE